MGFFRCDNGDDIDDSRVWEAVDPYLESELGWEAGKSGE